MGTRSNTRAFTLVELLVGLMVTSIILAAVATLAFAMSSASTVGGDSAFKQAHVRQATLLLSDLIGMCQLVCAAPDGDLVIWRDDNENGRINLNELTYVERGANNDYLRLCQFSSADNPEYSLSDLTLPATKQELLDAYEERYTLLLSGCSDVQFAYDVAPPRTGLLAITFGLTEDHASRQYEIATALRCRADCLLNASGDALVATDDD